MPEGARIGARSSVRGTTAGGTLIDAVGIDLRNAVERARGVCQAKDTVVDGLSFKCTECDCTDQKEKTLRTTHARLLRAMEDAG